MGFKYEHPTYTGPQPAEEISNGRLYTGSCHCGRVQVALSSKPIDETFSEPIAECKCSICERASPACLSLEFLRNVNRHTTECVRLDMAARRQRGPARS